MDEISPMTKGKGEGENVLENLLEKDEKANVPPRFFGSCRFTLTVMCFFGVYHLMALRFNISMAMVCMSSDPTIKLSMNSSAQNFTQLQEIKRTGCGGRGEWEPGTDTGEELDVYEELEFQWSKPLQGAILSSFFYGYILTQVLGGYTSDRWGGRNVLLYGILVLSLGTLLTPILARVDPHLLVVLRVIQGLASGFAFPSVYNIFTAWTPPEEKATLMSISFAGIATATVTIYPFVSWLCKLELMGGWPLAFYIPGATGLVWCVVFSQLIYNSPFEHPNITPEELSYIRKGLKSIETTGKHSVPWKQIVRSPVVHALWITHICSSFGYYLIMINISLFIREALGFPVIYNGFLSMLPSLGMLILSITGKLFDLIRTNCDISVTNLRKIFNSIAFLLPALTFVGLAILPCTEKVGHVALLAVGMAVHELAITGGFYFSHSEVGGAHSGVLFGITNTFAQIPGFLTPLLVSYMTQGGTLDEWYRVFQVAGSVYVLGGIVYIVFGSSELQPWAKPTPPTETQNTDQRAQEKVV